MLSVVSRKVRTFSPLFSVVRNLAVKCTASEALVETLAKHQVNKVFGIVGSAFIDPLDLFPAAGIDFVDVTHVILYILVVLSCLIIYMNLLRCLIHRNKMQFIWQMYMVA